MEKVWTCEDYTTLSRSQKHLVVFFCHPKLNDINEFSGNLQEEASLFLQWQGEPVEFYDNTSYTCRQENSYFEWDKVGGGVNIRKLARQYQKTVLL